VTNEEQAKNATTATLKLQSDIEKKKKRAERFGISLVVTDDDKVEQRSARFGVQSKENKSKEGLNNTKQVSRAKRFGVPVKNSDSKGQNVPQVNRSKNGNMTWSAEDEEKKRKRMERFASAQAPEEKKQKSE